MPVTGPWGAEDDLAAFPQGEDRSPLPEPSSQASGRGFRHPAQRVGTQGQPLKFVRIQHTNGVPLRLYRASGVVCQVCPAFGVCTRAKEIGRSLAIGPHDAVLRRHRAWMSTSAAREAYKLRKQLVEPVFGIIKEQQGARRFLLRGLVNVAAEWTMLATAFNLRTLWRVWRSSPFIGLFNGPEPCPVS